MLLYPAMKDLLKNIPSRYLLVNSVAARARKISSEAEQEGAPLTEKAVTLAINEVASGALRLDNAQAVEEDGPGSAPAEEDGQPAEEAGEEARQPEQAAQE